MVDARFLAAGWGLLVALTDLLPPRIRYGYVHPLTRRMFGRALPHLPAMVTREPVLRPNPLPVGERIRAALIGDGLDVGGIGPVIELLVRELPTHGVAPTVICSADGPRPQRLRALGVPVTVATTRGEGAAAIAQFEPAVLQLHSAPDFLERAALDSRLPLVPVLHNTEIHYTRSQWRRFRQLLAKTPAAIAVSATVRDYHLRHAAGQIKVIPNGVLELQPLPPHDRLAARRALGNVLGVDLADNPVVVLLARYDSQKNIAGTVSSFASASAARAHLVVAGDASDWAELNRADALRRASGAADRIHLLGRSDATTLLAAADAFLLNSFFEGWPVAATEALAAGLPVAISEVGGGRELAAADPKRSVVFGNAVGAADLVSDSRVRAAKRAAPRQANAAELAEALHHVLTASGEAGHLPDAAAMAAGHAAVLRCATRDASV